MRKLKSYDVIVVTKAQWAGTVQATSRADGRGLALDPLSAGHLQQRGEEVDHITPEEIRP